MRISICPPTVSALVLVGTKFYGVEFKGIGYFNDTLVQVIEKQKDNLVYAISLLSSCPDLGVKVTDFSYELAQDTVIMRHEDIEGYYTIESLEDWLQKQGI